VPSPHAPAAVYTAVIGGYEVLREEPMAAESALPFLCFTDDPGLTSQTWEIVVVEPRFRSDATRSARHLKICGHPRLEDYETTLWIDNTVELAVRPEQFLPEWLDEADLAAPLHSFHPTVLAEAEAVIDLGKDDFVRVYEQVAHYARTAAAALEQNPHWTAILARRRTASVAAAMQTWWEHVLRFSRRDQLSFTVAMSLGEVRLRSILLPNLSSALHAWPRAEGRREGSAETLRDTLRPPVAALGAAELERARLVHEVEARDLEISALGRERDRLAEQAMSDQHRANLLAAEVAEREQRLAAAETGLANVIGQLEVLRRQLTDTRARLNRQRGRRKTLEELLQSRGTPD